jgi:hypothetical protein
MSHLRLVRTEPSTSVDWFADTAERTRQALWNLKTEQVIAQARAFLTYDDPASALDSLLDFEPAFVQRYGGKPQTS